MKKRIELELTDKQILILIVAVRDYRMHAEAIAAINPAEAIRDYARDSKEMAQIVLEAVSAAE